MIRRLVLFAALVVYLVVTGLRDRMVRSLDHAHLGEIE